MQMDGPGRSGRFRNIHVGPFYVFFPYNYWPCKKPLRKRDKIDTQRSMSSYKHTILFYHIYLSKVQEKSGFFVAPRQAYTDYGGKGSRNFL